MKVTKEDICVFKIEYVIEDEDDTTPKTYPMNVMDTPFKEIYPAKTMTQTTGEDGIAKFTIYPPPDVIKSPYDGEKYKHAQTFLDGECGMIMPQGEIGGFRSGEHKLTHIYMSWKRYKRYQDYKSGKMDFIDAFEKNDKKENKKELVGLFLGTFIAAWAKIFFNLTLPLLLFILSWSIKSDTISIILIILTGIWIIIRIKPVFVNFRFILQGINACISEAENINELNTYKKMKTAQRLGFLLNVAAVILLLYFYLLR